MTLKKLLRGGGLKVCLLLLIAAVTLNPAETPKSYAAENAATSVSVQSTGSAFDQSQTSTGDFLITINHSNGRVTTKYLTLTQDYSTNALSYTITGQTDNEYIRNITVGKFAELSKEPGVLVSYNNTGVGHPFSVTDDSGWGASSACYGTTCLTVALKEKPQTNVTQVYSVPATGLPDGLSNIGLMAIGVGLLGLCFGMWKKRD